MGNIKEEWLFTLKLKANYVTILSCPGGVWDNMITNIQYEKEQGEDYCKECYENLL